ncbi:MAG: transglycosylase [Nautilia sp.]|nr:MAG: transglycosylase [Nautilia sp.]
MKKITLITALLTTSLLNANPTNDELKEFQNFKNQTNTEFNNYKKELNEGFKQYVDELSKGFNQYKKELSKYWDNPELSSKKVFVEYSKDKKIKKKVDFDKNYIELDVIAKNKKEAKEKMAKSLYSLATETNRDAFKNNPVLVKVNKKLKTNPKLQNVIKDDKPSNEPIITDIIFKKKPKTKQVINFAINTIKKHPIIEKKSKIPNTLIYSIRIPLPSNRLLVKAKQFKNDVEKRAKEFKLKEPFIFAIIHTESSFNPMARSYVPAFGLMQIVPTTAGADAYKSIYGRKKILTPGYLYNAHNNILIGSAYLKKIYYGYMRKIKNPISRLYCTIAAYNTGAGNVACAFNSTSKDYRGRTICKRSRGDYNIIKASYKINKMTPSQVYNHLLTNLKYDEPKKYLKKVTKRFLMYSKVLNSGKL